MQPLNANEAWLTTLHEVLTLGTIVAPRGKETRELLQHTMIVDMNYPVVVEPTRKLGEKFMVAEALWMLTGDNRVETIAPYNKNISQFSDDGLTFFGAYGPKIVEQLPYVINKLKQDRDSRQAGLTLWRESPPETKDVPCTISMFFNIRNGQLNMHVFMRSSDVWLGVPYDVFNFSMVAALVCANLNQRSFEDPVTLGSLYLTAASRHVYQANQAAACDVLGVVSARGTPASVPVPIDLITRESTLLSTLVAVRDGQVPGWWKVVE